MNAWLSDEWHKNMEQMLRTQGRKVFRLQQTDFYVLDGKAYSIRQSTVSDLGDWYEFTDALRSKGIILPAPNAKSQAQIQIVLFQPTEGHWSADAYLRGERLHCGKGTDNPDTALAGTLDWIKNNLNACWAVCGN